MRSFVLGSDSSHATWEVTMVRKLARDGVVWKRSITCSILDLFWETTA